ncbi:sialoadhesin-like [Oncorhynchus masou masou]|uniref:sialoadhesin-like n=1 Tax=Oncorhynchus masou masou TaxID=90313 RepID=UPI0031842CAC
MALRTAGSVLVVFLWSVAVVLGQYGWSVTYTTQSICTLKGSSVYLFCSYTYPRGTVTTTYWFTKMEAGIEPEDLSQDPEYAGRLEYHGDKKKDCTLRITDLRERDSATYKFRFLTDQEGGKYSGSPGVTLSVTALQVKVTTAAKGQKTLTCITTCTLTDNPTYIWYKNGQHQHERTSPQYKYSVYTNSKDSYSCAVKGHEDLPSPAVCVQGQSCNRVTYTKRTICALKGSTVDISCTYGSGYDTVKSSLWFSPKQSDSWRDELIPEDLTTDPGYAGRVEYVGEKERGRSTLRITDLREEDSAQYKFIFNTQTSRWGHSFPGTTLTVTDLQVKVTPATEAGKRTLTCITTCTLTDNPTYTWYKNGDKVKEDTSSLDSDSFSDADSYSCAVKGHEDLLSPAVCQKCWSVTYTHQKICALKGSRVDISCSYTYPSYHEIKQAFWFTKWSGLEAEDLSSVPGYEGHIEYLGDKESDCTLRITDLRLSDSAGFRFRFITSGGKFHGSPVSLTVTDVVLEMDPTSVSEGERVTLRCRTNCTLDPITAYSWYKNGQSIPNSNTSSPVYILFSVSSEDTGRYSCSVEGHENLPSDEETLTVTYGPRNTSVSVSPSGEIVEGSSVTLTCSSDANPPVDKYTWYKKNVASPKASGQSYNITNIISEDRGEYYCEAENIIASNNSTALMIIVAGKQTSVVTTAVGIIVVVLVLILCLSGLMWFRKRASKSPSVTRDTADDGQGDSSPVYDNISNMAMNPTAAQTESTYDQDDVHYASVHFSGSKNQEVPLYSTVQLLQPQKEDEDVQYAAVKFNLPSAATW